MKRTCFGITISFLALVSWISLFSPSVASAQAPTVTIDGSREPDKIPDWILWREMYLVAAMLADKSPDKGEEVWVRSVNLTYEHMAQLIEQGFAFRQEELAMNQKAKDMARSGLGRDSLQRELRQIQADKEHRILEMKELLRQRIGEQAFQRMQSFARLHIAPTVKVGTIQAAN